MRFCILFFLQHKRNDVFRICYNYVFNFLQCIGGVTGVCPNLTPLLRTGFSTRSREILYSFGRPTLVPSAYGSNHLSSWSRKVRHVDLVSRPEKFICECTAGPAIARWSPQRLDEHSRVSKSIRLRQSRLVNGFSRWRFSPVRRNRLRRLGN